MQKKSVLCALLAPIVAVTAWPQIAYALKDDIRGVRVGMSLDDARKVMLKDGGDCSIEPGRAAVICKFAEGNETNVLIAVNGAGDRVWRVQYEFHFHNTKNDVVAFLKAQYGLVKINQTGIVSGYMTASGLNAALQGAEGSNDVAVFSLYNASLKQKVMPLPKF